MPLQSLLFVASVYYTGDEDCSVGLGSYIIYCELNKTRVVSFVMHLQITYPQSPRKPTRQTHLSS